METYCMPGDVIRSSYFKYLVGNPINALKLPKKLTSEDNTDESRGTAYWLVTHTDMRDNVTIVRLDENKQYAPQNERAQFNQNRLSPDRLRRADIEFIENWKRPNNHWVRELSSNRKSGGAYTP